LQWAPTQGRATGAKSDIDPESFCLDGDKPCKRRFSKGVSGWLVKSRWTGIGGATSSTS
jgi:hypothetical protein